MQQQALFEQVRAFGTSGVEVPINPLLKAKALLALAEAKLFSNDAADARQWVEQALLLAPDTDRSTAAAVIRGVGHSLMGVVLLQQGNTGSSLESMQKGQRHLGALLGAQHPLVQVFALNYATVLHMLGRKQEALDVFFHAEPILRRSLGDASPTYIRIQRLKARLQSVAATSRSAAPDFFT